jgi:rod shape-determining protein MreC
MENFFTRYKNPLVLMVVLVIQVIGLATQIKRPDASKAAGGPRLIRVWTVTAITPLERILVATGHFFRNAWHGYVDLHNVRKQNRELQEELARMRLEQVRLKADAGESQRLQALLDFKERYVGQTVAAQVIQSSGNEQARLIYIDKGSRDGIRQDMAVITPDGIVGKVKDVYPLSSQVLMINDRESGAGVILENSRLQGVLRGKDLGELQLPDIMSDEKVEVGERVVTSGGDRIYPKGFPVGTVTRVTRDKESGTFLAITIKPATDLNRLEDVLVVTKIAEEAPAVADTSQPRRAADVLAQRLPSIPKPEENDVKKAAPALSGNKAAAASASATTPGATGGMKKKIRPATPKAASVPGADQKPKVGALSPRPEAVPAPAQESGSADGPKPAEPNPPTAPSPQQPPATGSEKPPR